MFCPRCTKQNLVFPLTYPQSPLSWCSRTWDIQKVAGFGRFSIGPFSKDIWSCEKSLKLVKNYVRYNLPFIKQTEQFENLRVGPYSSTLKCGVGDRNRPLGHGERPRASLANTENPSLVRPRYHGSGQVRIRQIPAWPDPRKMFKRMKNPDIRKIYSTLCR